MRSLPVSRGTSQDATGGRGIVPRWRGKHREPFALAELTIKDCHLANVLLGDLAGDFPGSPERAHRLVKADHAVLAARDQVIVDALDLARPDGAGDRVRVPEDFECQVPLRPAVRA